MSSVSGDTQPEEARIFLDSEGRGVMGSGKRTLSVRTILRAWGTSREMITKPESSAVQAQHLFPGSHDT